NGNKPLLIEAGPGAGKTRVMIERIKYLVNEKAIDPESLLVITFSNKSAEELKNRLIDSVNGLDINIVNKMQVSTIHSFCYSLLREHENPFLEILGDDLGEKNDLFIRKHMKDLGFVDEAYISKRDIGMIISKFNEYTIFKVDIDNLISYIEEKFPPVPEYLSFIAEIKKECEENEEHFSFPSVEVKEDENLKRGYHNARFLAIAKAYKIYQDLLKDYNVIDFGFIQRNTLDLLENNPELVANLKYKNILVDEFQDTDPVQMKIFDLLINNENMESFTVVGDDDQSIYAFRGSDIEFFTNFEKEYDADCCSLNTNYRSSNTIVEFNENFIKNDRRSNSSKVLKGNNETDGNVFLLENDDKKDQAYNILKTIKHLIETEKVKNFSDIAILSRSVRDAFTKEIIATLEDNQIPCQIRGNQDLLDTDEIKSILTLFYYLVQDDDNPHISFAWERDWLNLDAYSSKTFDSLKFFNLSNETREILSKKEEEYREELLNTARQVQKEETGSARVRSFNGVFNLDEDLLIKIFRIFDKPIISLMDMNDLKAIGIANQNDLSFFNKLYDLKQLIISNTIFKSDSEEEISNKLNSERITLLDIFYKLLEIIGYYNKDKVLNESNTNELANIAIISNSIANYEDIISQRGTKFSITGLFWFIYHRIKGYSCVRLNDEDGVQILTIHSSKGLEFPIIIVPSLKEGKFPSKYRDEDEKLYGAFGIPFFKTPDEFLEYKKNMNKQEKEEFHDLEERRVLYVGMSRAEDILILSTLEGIPEIENIDFDNILKLNNNLDILPFTRYENEDKESNDEDNINLSYTSLRDYENCPFKYNLFHNFNFKVSQDKYIHRGIAVHDTLDKIHKAVKENESLKDDEDFIEKIAKDSLIENEAVALKQFEDINYYWQNYGKNLEILGSEVLFSLITRDYNLSGKIDLIYKTEEGKIGILDFKNQTNVDKKEVTTQLYIYLLAISQNPDFSKYEVNELAVYPLKGRKWINIELNHDKIKEIEDEIKNTVLDIRNNNFYPKETNLCEGCEFRFICENK
ncbi:MAG: ATP-dependent helicase, partial [Methanobrevibacter sp.]|nr:ATP-dependent helicase [Methanobrevibacter sp.]